MVAQPANAIHNVAQKIALLDYKIIVQNANHRYPQRAIVSDLVGW